MPEVLAVGFEPEELPFIIAWYDLWDLRNHILFSRRFPKQGVLPVYLIQPITLVTI